MQLYIRSGPWVLFHKFLFPLYCKELIRKRATARSHSSLFLDYFAWNVLRFQPVEQSPLHLFVLKVAKCNPFTHAASRLQTCSITISLPTENIPQLLFFVCRDVNSTFLLQSLFIFLAQMVNIFPVLCPVIICLKLMTLGIDPFIQLFW